MWQCTPCRRTQRHISQCQLSIVYISPRLWQAPAEATEDAMGVGPSSESPQHGMTENDRETSKAVSRNSCISGSSSSSDSSFISPPGELPVKKAASSCSGVQSPEQLVCLKLGSWVGVPYACGAMLARTLAFPPPSRQSDGPRLQCRWSRNRRIVGAGMHRFIMSLPRRSR